MAINKRENDKSKRSPINEEIDAAQVRLILDDGTQKGVVSIKEALETARAAKLDLVLISPEADPVVCKVMDYGKHVFELKKQRAANRKKQKVIEIKEIVPRQTVIHFKHDFFGCVRVYVNLQRY